MALQNKTRWSQLRVGLMAIAALVILSVLIFLMAGSQGLFRSRTILYTYMMDSHALAEGSPVRLNGILVGKVSAVGLSGQADPKRLVKVSMDIDENYLSSIPEDSKALMTAENLLGTKYINIQQGTSKQNAKGGGEIASLSSTEMDDLFNQGNTMISALQITLKRVDGIIAQVESGNGTIGKLLVDETLYRKVLSIMDEAEKLTKTMNNGNGTVGKLFQSDELYQDVRTGIGKINSLLEGLEQGKGTAGLLLKDTAIHDDLRGTIADFRKLMEQLQSDKGDIGKLMKSDDLHKQIAGTLGRMDSLLDKINNGQGTLGQLVVNPQLYETLDGTTREIQSLMKDFHSNPKKFLSIKLGLF
jgi:phospholipid/cholesterol/gamma-HCH transport system substrate-binding protein